MVSFFWLVLFSFLSASLGDDYMVETNNVRMANNVANITYNRNVENAAIAHNNEMVNNNCFSHQCSGEPSLSTRLTNANYDWAAAAENIAKGYANWKDCINGWMGDSGHRKNVLGNYKDLGCASGSDGTNTYYTCDYASPQ